MDAEYSNDQWKLAIHCSSFAAQAKIKSYVADSNSVSIACNPTASPGYAKRGHFFRGSSSGEVEGGLPILWVEEFRKENCGDIERPCYLVGPK
jgi:hypothetical protein